MLISGVFCNFCYFLARYFSNKHSHSILAESSSWIILFIYLFFYDDRTNLKIFLKIKFRLFLDVLSRQLFSLLRLEHFQLMSSSSVLATLSQTVRDVLWLLSRLRTSNGPGNRSHQDQTRTPEIRTNISVGKAETSAWLCFVFWFITFIMYL